MTQKRIKVQYRSRSTSNGYTDVPMIQMTGNWLESLGFSIGDTIMLDIDESGIHIRPLTADEQNEEAQASLFRSIRKRQKELTQLQSQLNTDLRRMDMVAEPDFTYDGR